MYPVADMRKTDRRTCKKENLSSKHCKRGQTSMKNRDSRRSLPGFCWPDCAGNPLSERFKKHIWLWRALQTTLSSRAAWISSFALRQLFTHIIWSDSHTRYRVHRASQMCVKRRPMKIKEKIITISHNNPWSLSSGVLAVQTQLLSG